MSSRHFEEQMRLFEAEVGANHTTIGRMPMPGSQAPPPPPAFLPHSVRAAQFMPQRGHVPPPPTYPRPPGLIHPTTAMPSVNPLSRMVPPAIKKQYAAAPVINKPKEDEDDDIMATLMKYEKEVKGDPTSDDKKGVKRTASAGSSEPPNKWMKPSQISSQQPPKPPAPKPGTEVTPEEIRNKAKQMVEMVKASQITQTVRVTGNNSGGKQGDRPGGKKSKKVIRMAGGQMWEDSSLQDWDTNDFRIFCGDLGNDVTDEVLTRTFSRYPSFQKAKVVRDKRSNKTKGYGFVSFKDPTDFTRAIKEMDGKYVGSRPIKLRKSNWKDRNVDQVKQKQKMKMSLGYKM